MAEYIEREAAIAQIWNMCLKPGDWIGGNSAMEEINRVPAADVRPVVWGEWIDRGSLSCRCSECGCKSTKESNFCPNCGADMRGSIPEERTAAMWASRPTSESEAAQFARRVGREEV